MPLSRWSRRTSLLRGTDAARDVRAASITVVCDVVVGEGLVPGQRASSNLY